MTTLSWSSGTAYDFFISLYVLHHAGRFGLRASWAAGVRQRVSPTHRAFFEKLMTFAPVPLGWIARLPEPRDSAVVLDALAALDPAARLPEVLTTPEMAANGVTTALLSIASQGKAGKAEQDFLRANYIRRADPLKPAALANLLECWSRPQETGTLLLSALQEYRAVFFAEEERRIVATLRAGLDEARALADELDVDALVTRLSRGVHFDSLDSTRRLILAPSYWSAPLVFIARLDEDEALIAFGARPDHISLISGEDASDAIVTPLKALADPTRLRILRDLAVQPLTPAELVRRLRLRPPTVIHHLRILRLAGLVEITVSAGSERMYAARLSAIEAVSQALVHFVKS
ncbi:MAG: metalloregulator ArsR/SmtB family transcription factor [Anaerolineales bacterium]